MPDPLNLYTVRPFVCYGGCCVQDSDLTGVVDLRYTGGARMLLMLEIGEGRWRFKVRRGNCFVMCLSRFCLFFAFLSVLWRVGRSRGGVCQV